MRLAWFAAASAALAAIAGCTFLVSFDDPLPPIDDSGAPVRDSSTPTDGGPPADARAGFDPTKSDACKGRVNGHYCGNNQLTNYPFPDDLVRCRDGGVTDVQICDLHCLHLKNPHPDECDECKAKPDGYYCGRDFPGWDTSGTGSNSNANIRVHCQSGIQDLLEFQCTTCTSKTVDGGGAAICNQ